MIEKLGIELNWKRASINNFPILGEHGLHLWWLPLSLTQAESEYALSLLSDLQREKYQRRMTPELKQAYLAGRYYLLTLLAAYKGCSAEKIKLSYSRLNKPFLDDNTDQLEFNFTDTHDNDEFYGLFGFSKARPLGVDIENRSRKIDLSKLVSKRFTHQEQAFVDSVNGIDKARGLSIWTRKEAYGKATGQGINFKMNQHNLVPDCDHTAVHAFNFTDTNKRSWRCTPLSLGSDFVASCVHSGHTPLTISAFNRLNSEPN